MKIITRVLRSHIGFSTVIKYTFCREGMSQLLSVDVCGHSLSGGISHVLLFCSASQQAIAHYKFGPEPHSVLHSTFFCQLVATFDSDVYRRQSPPSPLHRYITNGITATFTTPLTLPWPQKVQELQANQVPRPDPVGVRSTSWHSTDTNTTTSGAVKSQVTQLTVPVRRLCRSFRPRLARRARPAEESSSWATRAGVGEPLGLEMNWITEEAAREE